MRLCEFDGCERKRHARGLCCTHYKRIHRGEAKMPREVDPIAVERIITGDPPSSYYLAERLLAVKQLDAWGLTAEQIADRIGTTERNVVRDRGRIRAGDFSMRVAHTPLCKRAA